METKNTYKSFNEDKTVEELQYNMLQHKLKLLSLETELNFYVFIIKTSIFKPNIINLFERLEQFKTQITQLKKTTNDLLYDVNLHIKSINNKIECEDLICDKFFIKAHNEIEERIHFNFKEITSLKTQMFEYLQSVIQNQNY